MGSDVYGGALTAEAEGRTPARAVRERVDPIVAAIVFALFARTFLFQAFAVPSRSMEKNVLTGDRLLVNKFVYAPLAAPLATLLPARAVRRGDVVVFRFPPDPSRDFIKRVVGLPGETVEIRDRTVFVDGRPLREPYVFHADDRIWPDDPDIPEEKRRRDQLPPTRIPEGAYFVMGDNRDDSSDSRAWGPVREGFLVGRALFVYWSLPPHESLARTRWERTFLPVR